MDKPCQRMAVEFPRENRDKRTKWATDGLLRVAAQGSMEIEMQGDKLVGAETFAARVKGCNRLHVR